jgi:ATP-dependent helicase/nuclease subunit A
LHAVWAKADGEMRSFGKGQAPQDAAYAELAIAAFECCDRLLRMRKLAAVVTQFAAALRAGKTFAAAYAEAKRAHGVVDFDDLITGAQALLETPGMGEWVRYKLDQATDHILVDEAQDTNERQWAIVGALSENSSPARARRAAIARCSPSATSSRRSSASRAPIRASSTRHAAISPQRRARSATARSPSTCRAGSAARLPRSFHGPQLPLLAAGAALRGPGAARSGLAALGLPRTPNVHESFHSGRPGSVTLWEPWTEETETSEDAGEEGWISDATRRYASCLAKQIKRWIAHPFTLGGKGKERPVRPEDILILVRRRGALAALLVARLHAEGVPVAGVDRLLLSAPLASGSARRRPLRRPAARRLNLAGLLVSPLFGWSQDQLYAAASAERASRSGRASAAAGPIGDAGGPSRLLAMADYTTPHQFLETISPARWTAAASCCSGSAPKPATRSRSCSPPRWTSRPAPPPRSSRSSTGSRAAMSKSCAILRLRSMRCG